MNKFSTRIVLQFPTKDVDFLNLQFELIFLWKCGKWKIITISCCRNWNRLGSFIEMEKGWSDRPFDLKGAIGLWTFFVGTSRASLSYQKLCTRVIHIRNNCGGQPVPSAMNQPHSGKTAFLIPTPGKFTVLEFRVPFYESKHFCKYPRINLSFLFHKK